MAAGVHHARLPEGGCFDQLRMPDGWPIRRASWPGTRGTLLVAGGRADFIEKYGEAVRHWVERGWAVTAFDWRGQGGSGRLGITPLHGAPGPFSRWVRDLGILIGATIARGPTPIAAIGHSMGGHLLLRALVEGEARLHRAVLNAPMLAIRSTVPAWMVTALMQTGIALGRGCHFAPGQPAIRDRNAEARRRLLLTHDADRGAEEAAWLAAHPDLALGGPTFRWVADAFHSIETTLRAGGLEAVRTPVLAVAAGEDRIVDNGVTRKAMARLPFGTYVEIAGGAHELWRETDAIRTRALSAIDQFLEQQ